MIAFEGVTVSVAAPGGPGGRWVDKTLLGGVSCTLTERRVAVLGANGSGKSTLLRLVNGLATATRDPSLLNDASMPSRPAKCCTMSGVGWRRPRSSAA